MNSLGPLPESPKMVGMEKRRDLSLSGTPWGSGGSCNVRYSFYFFLISHFFKYRFCSCLKWKLKARLFKTCANLNSSVHSSLLVVLIGLTSGDRSSALLYCPLLPITVGWAQRGRSFDHPIGSEVSEWVYFTLRQSFSVGRWKFFREN